MDSGNLSTCELCGTDLKTPPIVADPDAVQRQERLDAAVKCLDELIVIVMERIAVQHRIDEEDLAEACKAVPESDDEDDVAEPPEAVPENDDTDKYTEYDNF